MKMNLKIKNISDLELLKISKLDNLIKSLDTFQEYLRQKNKYSDLTTEQQGILQMVTDNFHEILYDNKVDLQELQGD